MELAKFSKNFVNNLFSIIRLEYEKKEFFNDNYKEYREFYNYDKFKKDKSLGLVTTINKYKGLSTQITCFFHHFINIFSKYYVEKNDKVYLIDAYIKYGALHTHPGLKLVENHNLFFSNIKKIKSVTDDNKYLDDLKSMTNLFDTTLKIISPNIFKFSFYNLDGKNLFQLEYGLPNISENKYDNLVEQISKNTNVKNKNLVRMIITAYYYKECINKNEKDLTYDKIIKYYEFK